MSILSDRTIKNLCTKPLCVYRTQSHGINGMDKFFHGSNEDYARFVEDNAKSFGMLTIRLDNHPWLQDWQPMIEPFFDKQVRYERRPATQRDLSLIHMEGYKTDWKREVVDGEWNEQMVRKVVSYGTSSYGYDVTCADEFKIFTNINSTIVDPKNFDEKSFVEHKGEFCIIPPNSFALARTKEYFRIPRDVLTVCLGKSTYARCGIVVNVTPFEPEWEGYVTLEFSNTTPLPAKIYANEGVAQVLFFRGDKPCEVSYKDRGGKYMKQEASPVVPRL